MRSFKLLAFLVMACSVSLAQDLRLDFVKDFSTGSVTDSQHDAAGNYYIVGQYYCGDNNFNTNDGFSSLPCYDASYYDGYLTKYDAAGNLIWSRAITSNGYDYPTQIDIDDAGNVVVVGFFSGDNLYADNSNFIADNFNYGYYEGFLVQFDAAGNFVTGIKIPRISAFTDLIVNDVTLDGFGAAFVTGTDNNQIFFSRYNLNTSGFVWTQKLPGGYQETPQIEYMFGLLAVSGNFYSNINLDPVFFSQPLTSQGNADFFLTYYDSFNGSLIGSQYTASATNFGTALVTELSIDLTQGYAYVAGRFENTLDFTNGSATLNSNGYIDVFVAKYELGVPGPDWVKSYGGISEDYISDMEINQYGDVYITGKFNESNVDFNPDISLFYPLSPNGDFDGYLLKLKSNGDFAQAFNIGAFNPDEFQTISIDRRNQLVISGRALGQSIIDFDPTEKIQNGALPATGNFALIKYVENPVILNINPKSGQTGGTVNLVGRNFSPNHSDNKVYFGSVLATTNSVINDVLNVTVPPGATYDKITVTANGRTAESPVKFTPTFVGNPTVTSGALGNQSSFVLGTSASDGNTIATQTIAVGDFDGNGINDIASANPLGNGVTVYPNSGTVVDGEFVLDPSIELPTPSDPKSIAVADMNNDGKLDIITANSSDQSISVLINISTTSGIVFEDAKNIVTSLGASPAAIGVTDLDMDGKMDIIITTTNSNFLVYGDIDFELSTAQQLYSQFLPAASNNFAIGDLDGDKKPDLLFNQSGSTLITCLRNNSEPGLIDFDPQASRNIDAPAGAVFIGDLDGDGKPEIGATRFTANGQVVIFKNVATSGSLDFASSFGTMLPFNVGPNQLGSLTLANVNGDTFLDVVVANRAGGVFVLQNEATSDFDANSLADPVQFGTGEAISVIAADLTGDDKPEVIYSGGYLINQHTLNILENGIRPIPAITGINPRRAASGSTVIIAGEWFSDVAEENIVYFGATRATVTSASENSLQVTVPSGATPGPISVTVHGFTAYSQEHFNMSFDMNGEVAISYSVPFEFTPLAPSEQTRREAIADLDGDGKPDLIVPSPGTDDNLLIFRNESVVGNINDASFVQSIVDNAGPTPYHVAAGDLNRDGKLDLVTAHYEFDVAAGISFYTNQSSPGAISLSTRAYYPYEIGVRSTFVAIHDLNGDGLPEVLAANDHDGGTGSVRIFPNSLTGFETPLGLPANGGVWSVAVSDMDKDGKPDVIMPSINGIIYIYRNISQNGVLEFETAFTVPVTASPSIIAVQDVDGDSWPDIVSGSSTNNVILIRNEFSGSLNFGPPVYTDMSPNSTWNIALGDITGDGKPDLLRTMQNGVNTGSIDILENVSTIGSASSVWFSYIGSINTLGSPLTSSFSDLDGDGRTDLIVSNEGTNKLQIFRNINTSQQPLVQPNGLTFSEITANAVNGSFNYIVADGFIVLRNVGGPVTDTPQDGVAYPVGYILPNGAEVVATGNQTSFNSTGLDGTSTYHFAVFSFNGKYNAVNYLGENPLTGTVTPSGSTLAHENQFQWAKAITSSTSDNLITGGIATDASGNVYVTGGFTDGMTDFNPDPDVTTTGYAKTDNQPDAFVAKYGPAGNLLNLSHFTSADGNNEHGEAIAVDAAGNIYVAGMFADNIVFAEGGGPTSELFTNGSYDLFLASFDANFNFKWAVPIGSPGGDVEFVRNGLEVDSNGDVYLSGEFRGTANFGNGVQRTASNNNFDAFVAKYSASNGTLQWVRQQGGDDDDVSRDLSIDKDGNVYVMAQMSSNAVAVETSELIFSERTSVGSTDVLIMKYDPFGSLFWAHVVGGPFDDSGEGISVDNNGSVYISGNYYAYADFETAPGRFNYAVAENNNEETFLAKYNAADGSLLWVKSLRSSDGQAYAGVRVVADTNENVFMLGSSNAASLNVDPNGGVKAYVSEDGLSDVILTKFSSDGALRWSGKIGSTGDVNPGDLNLDRDNNLVVLASFTGTVSPNPEDINQDIQINAGGNDVLMVKFGTQDFVSTTIPSISSFSPEFGDAGTIVTITGENFAEPASNNLVYFGATQAMVQSGSSTSLTVVSPTGATYNAITVFANGRTASADKPFLTTFTSGTGLIQTESFESPVEVPIGGVQPNKFAVDDFNNDGKPDLVIANVSSNTISIIENGTSAGTISSANVITSGSELPYNNPWNITMDDIDGDGKRDLIVTSYQNNIVTIFRNTGADNPFQQGVDFPVLNSAEETAVRDLDNDGKLDLVVIHETGMMSIFRNRATPGSITSSSFANRQDISTSLASPSSSLRSVVIDDLNNDGLADVALAAGLGSDLQIFMNNSTPGAIVLSSSGTISASPVIPRDIVTGDFNNDSNLDLAVGGATVDGRGFAILINNGAASFSEPIFKATSQSVSDLAAGDVSGDGKVDIFVGHPVVFVNVFDGTTFSSSSIEQTLALSSSSPGDAMIVDYDGDGAQDLVFTEANLHKVYVVRNNTLITTPTTQVADIDVTVNSPTEIQLNFTQGNGTHQIVVMQESSTDVTELPQDGQTFDIPSASFTSGVELSPGSPSKAVTMLQRASVDQKVITDLSPGTQYSIALLEYNDNFARSTTTSDKTKFNRTIVAGQNTTSFYTYSTEPTSSPDISAVATGPSIRVSFPAAESIGAIGYLVYRSIAQDPTLSLVDGQAAPAPFTTTNSTDTFFDDTDVTVGTTYHYAVIPFNQTSGIVETTNYLTDGAELVNASPIDLSSEPASSPTAYVGEATSSAITVSFTAAAGSPTGYIAFRSIDGTPTFEPLDAQSYVEGEEVASGVIVAQIGSEIEFTNTGLASATRYFYSIFSYNLTDGAINYKQSDPLTGDTRTLVKTPAVQASQIIFSGVSSEGISMNVTPGDGNGRVVIVKQGVAVDATPQDGATYTANAEFGSGSVINIDNFVIGASSETNFTISNLQPGTQYTAQVFEFNDFLTGGNSTSSQVKFLTAVTGTNNPKPFFTLSAEPESFPANLAANAIEDDVTLTYDPVPNADGYVLLKSTQDNILSDAIPLLIDGAEVPFPLPNGIIASIYSDNDPGNIVELNLPQATYYYALVPYTRASETQTINYKTDGVPVVSVEIVPLATQPSAPTALVLDGITQTSINVSFTGSGADGYFVIRKVGAPSTFSPLDGLAPNLQQLQDNESVVSIGASTSVVDDNLIPGVTYYYYVFAYNGVGGATNYQTPALNGNEATAPPTETFTTPTTQAIDLQITARSESSVTLSFNPQSHRTLIAVTQGDPSADLPVDETSYTTNSVYGESSALLAGQTYLVGATDLSSFTVTGLDPQQKYTVTLYSYNDAAGAIGFTSPVVKFNRDISPENQQSFFTLSTSPATHPTGAFIADQNSLVDVDLTFTAPSVVAASGYLLIRTNNTEVESGLITDGSEVTVPSTLGQMSILAKIEGGTTSFKDVGPLNPGATYGYFLVPYNWDGTNPETYNFKTEGSFKEVYITTPNFAASPQLPTALSVTQSALTAVNVNITPSATAPSGYLLVRRTGSAATFVPVDGVIYSDGVDGTTGEMLTKVEGGTSISATSLTAGSEYHFKVYAYNNTPSGALINYNTEPQTPTTSIILDNVAPQFGTDATPAIVEANGTLSFNISATDDASITSVVASWRRVESQSSPFETVSLSGNGNTYTGSLSNANAELGIEYRFVATDEFGNARTSASKFVRIATTSANAPTLPYSAFGSQQSNYRMISVPLSAANNTVSSVFTELGQVDNSKWRMFRYSNATTSELSGSSQIEPGKGYWLIVKDNPGPIKVEGTTVAANPTSPFQIQLAQGWNQIGNPYNFNISWDDVISANPAANLPQKLTTFDGQFKDTQSVLNKFEGAFVNVSSAVTISIPVTKNPSVNGGRVRENARLTNPLDSEDWELYLNLKHGLLENTYSGIGMRSTSEEGWDRFDGMSLPRFNGFLDLNHTKTAHGYHFAKDVIKTKDSHIWEFEVESSESTESDITFSWDNTYFGSNGKSLILWDVAKQLGINMREQSQYTFAKNSSGQFKVIFGDEEYLKENTRVNALLFHDIVPNPVEDEALIRFTLPQADRVSIEVMDISGKKTEIVFNGELAEGYHEVKYDRGVYSNASGVFIAIIRAGKSTAQQRMILK